MNAPEGVPTPRSLSPLATAILRYLAEHPEARDSVEGIHAWWLEDGEATWRRRDVEQAVSLLVAEGWMRGTRIGGAHLFSLSPDRLAEIADQPGVMEARQIDGRPSEEGDVGEY